MNNPEEDKIFRLTSALLDAAASTKVFENMSPSGAKMSAVVILAEIAMEPHTDRILELQQICKQLDNTVEEFLRPESSRTN